MGPNVPAAVLLDVSDGRRGPRNRFSLYQRRQGGVGTGRLPPENKQDKQAHPQTRARVVFALAHVE